MNKKSIDIFAETNPALCSLILFYFCNGYEKTNTSGAPFPLVIIVLPIILSNDLSSSFNSTNIKTGFFRWVERTPSIVLNISDRINDSNEFIKPAIEYGLFKKIFNVNEFGNLKLIDKSVKKKKYDFEHLFKHAERLGSWMGEINSVKTIYNHLGIQI
ncbi:hypothetical protein G1K57_04150 [Tenacibaculum finnmarkense]|uniref:three component ABC system middle component n=1 Tax=Tenacibaculum finnmarkense TaxID=2781243 RepID=UPI001EFB3F56|nr:three component ABC system middle component [Tenacibaculum finnmarkense]MCG8807334.1 hypothetical protein [Tenacibaculum finnmarkense]MCG8817575.1 hypothetical protein [Tenacibaculum finnmarkense]MCG8857825.1 hypothetical protein [Tenacibaculum finnmarkense]